MNSEQAEYQPIKWESVKDLSDRMPFSEDSIYDMAKNQEIPGRKFKGKWLFDPKEMDEFFIQNMPKLARKYKVKGAIKKLVENKLKMLKNPTHSGKSEETPFQIRRRD